MSIESIFIIAALALTGLALITLVGFGVRNMFYGKQKISSILFAALPVAIFLGLGFSGMEWATAGIWTTLIILALASLGLLVSSVRGLIGI